MSELAAVALAACIAVAPSSDRITIGDLAAHVSGLESLSASRQISLAPAPGVKRVFTIAELHRLGVQAEHELCFARPVAPLTPERVLEAMHHPLPQARIELIEISRLPAPDGAIEFPISGLHSTPAGSLWTGYVQYGGNRRFYIWAKVKIPNDINRGETVKVEVHSGAAVLELEAQAETSGVAGQPVSLLNPSSRRRFQGKIQGPGRAIVGKIQ